MSRENEITEEPEPDVAQHRLAVQAEERRREEVDELHKNLRVEFDQLLATRADLNIQVRRVKRRLDHLRSLLGIKGNQSHRLKRTERRLHAISRLMHDAGGPMSLASVVRELEAVENTKMTAKKAWAFMSTHGDDFVNVGEGLWYLRAEWGAWQAKMRKGELQ